jgi:hypothetical protein
MFTICSFNSPDLDGYQGTRENKNVPRETHSRYSSRGFPKRRSIFPQTCRMSGPAFSLYAETGKLRERQRPPEPQANSDGESLRRRAPEPLVETSSRRRERARDERGEAGKVSWMRGHRQPRPDLLHLGRGAGTLPLPFVSLCTCRAPAPSSLSPLCIDEGIIRCPGHDARPAAAA